MVIRKKCRSICIKRNSWYKNKTICQWSNNIGCCKDEKNGTQKKIYAYSITDFSSISF